MIAAAVIGAATAALPVGAWSGPAVLDRHVSFAVHNTNTSAVPCSSDNATYRVAGHLVGPSALLGDGPHAAVTVYLHGSGGGQFWHFRM